MRNTIRASALLLTLALTLAPLSGAGSDKTSTATGNVTKVSAAERIARLVVALVRAER